MNVLVHTLTISGFEVRLTGLLSTHPVPAGQEDQLPEYGTLVAPGVNAA
jgi:Cu2+-containing amine oxidase